VDEKHLVLDLYHRDIIQVVHHLWTDPRHKDFLHMEYEPQMTDSGEWTVYEAFHGDWWKNTEVIVV
jgi:hypothetical protein